jgi:two-component system phosphate regulon sensor histidine kinase PhoR
MKIAEIVERTSVEGPRGGSRTASADRAGTLAADQCGGPHERGARKRSGIIIVFHDLTHLKQLERTRQEFVANVSHELRTPLSLIKGYAETLLDGAKDNPEVATKFLQTIDRNARRLDLLIQDLLIISSLESGRVSLSLGPVDLRNLVARMLVDFKSRAEARHVQLVSVVPELMARADEARLGTGLR